jgi:superfamily II DNA/RNA helicase
VFVRTKRGADRLVKRLKAAGVGAVAMHGDKTQGQRERALKSFVAGKVTTLVATDVAARGLDVDGITHVIQFDPPVDAETYTHRVGRTGRAGRKGIGITLLTPDQHGDVTRIAGRLGLDHGLHNPAAGNRKAGPGAAPRNPRPAGRRPRRRRIASRA